MNATSARDTEEVLTMTSKVERVVTVLYSTENYTRKINQEGRKRRDKER